VIRRAVLLVLLALVVLLVVADRLTEQAAARAVSVEARQAGLLAADPTVSIAGFPFLTQALHHRYQQIDVTTHGIHRGGLRLDTVSGRFRGVHAGLGATLDGRLTGVRVDAGSGDVDITDTDLEAFLARRHLMLTVVGTTLQLSGKAPVAGAAVAASGPVTVSVVDAALTIAPVAAQLRGATGAALAPTTAGTVAAGLTVRVALTALPFGVVPTSVVVEPTQLRLTGSARGPAVAVPADAAQG
jgi:hypothetical protein